MGYERMPKGHGVTGGSPRSRLIALGRILSVVLIVAGLVLLVMAIEKANENRYRSEQAGQKIELPDETRTTTEYNGSVYTLKKKLETTLVIGIDTFEEEIKEGEPSNIHQADLLYLIVADKTNNTYSTIHINRDTMATVKVLSSTGNKLSETVQQICLAYGYGSTFPIQSRNTIDAVSTLFNGIKIDHYVSITMDSVAVLNDAVGGITVEVMDDVDEMKAGEYVTLTGDQALRYVRARRSIESNPTNVRRMERQEQYISEFRRQFGQKAAESSTFALEALSDISRYMHSDCSIEQIADLANTIVTCECSGDFKLEGETGTDGTYVQFHADPDKLAELYLKVFCDKIG
ncbi:MAG: LCP family protein [Clostridia bacterium]|nr:LCP family protein [Clostridia bacterium]